MSNPNEMSQLQRQLLSGGGGVTLYTQQEFDDALAIGKAEIMMVAIDTTKTAIKIERDECAKVAEALADEEEEGELATAIRNVAMAIRNRIPSQNL